MKDSVTERERERGKVRDVTHDSSLPGCTGWNLGLLADLYSRCRIPSAWAIVLFFPRGAVGNQVGNRAAKKLNRHSH